MCRFWSRSRAWVCVVVVVSLVAACSGLPPIAAPTATATTIATPLPPTLGGITGAPYAVGQPIALGSLVVTVQREITLDAGAGFTYVGAVLVIQAAGGTPLDSAKLPGTALIDASLHVYEVDPSATSAVLAAAQATPVATPSSATPVATPSAATPVASPAAGTPVAEQTARAVVGFRVPTGASGLQLVIDGRAAGGEQVLVNL